MIISSLTSTFDSISLRLLAELLGPYMEIRPGIFFPARKLAQARTGKEMPKTQPGPEKFFTPGPIFG